MGEQLGESRTRPSSVDNISPPFLKEQYKHATQSMESAMLHDCWPSGWLIHHGPKQLVVSTVWKSRALCQRASNFRSNSTSVNETIKNTLQMTSLYHPTLHRLYSLLNYQTHFSSSLWTCAHNHNIKLLVWSLYFFWTEINCVYMQPNTYSLFFFFSSFVSLHRHTKCYMEEGEKVTATRDV